MSGWEQLVQWVAGGKHAWRVTANLLGLLDLGERFAVLHAAFQWSLQQASPTNPLRMLLRPVKAGGSFASHMKTSPLFECWKLEQRGQQHTREALGMFLRRHHGNLIWSAAQRNHLTRIVAADLRLKQDLRYADVVLAAPLSMQELFLSYRRGAWRINQRHLCSSLHGNFHRGDEACPCFGGDLKLSVADFRRWRVAKRRYSNTGLVTVVDYWLNTRQFGRAACLLRKVEAKLGKDFGAGARDSAGNLCGASDAVNAIADNEVVGVDFDMDWVTDSDL